MSSDRRIFDGTSQWAADTDVSGTAGEREREHRALRARLLHEVATADPRTPTAELWRMLKDRLNA